MAKLITVVLTIVLAATPLDALARPKQDSTKEGCYVKVTRNGTKQCCYTGDSFEVSCRPLPNSFPKE
jgi:hypothetical protein